MEAMGAIALLLIYDSSFTCEDYNTYGSVKSDRTVHVDMLPTEIWGADEMSITPQSAFHSAIALAYRVCPQNVDGPRVEWENFEGLRAEESGLYRGTSLIRKLSNRASYVRQQASTNTRRSQQAESVSLVSLSR